MFIKDEPSAPSSGQDETNDVSLKNFSCSQSAADRTLQSPARSAGVAGGRRVNWAAMPAMSEELGGPTTAQRPQHRHRQASRHTGNEVT